MKHKKWSTIEDTTLKRNVNKFGIREGCRITGIQTERTQKACEHRVYTLKEKGKFLYTANSIKNNKEVAKVLAREIHKNPGNLSKAFIKAEKKTGVSRYTLRGYYYSKNNNSVLSRDNLGVNFCMFGYKGIANKKNFDSKDSIDMPKGFWNQLKSLFKSIKK